MATIHGFAFIQLMTVMVSGSTDGTGTFRPKTDEYREIHIADASFTSGRPI
jgi:hypothetical protein